MIRPMLRVVVAISLLTSPVWAADSKEVSCRHQADVMSAIQKARLDRVSEGDVSATLAASNPSWPDNYNAAIPQLTAWVYQQKRRVLKKTDLGADLHQQCLQNWDQIQAMQKQIKN